MVDADPALNLNEPNGTGKSSIPSKATTAAMGSRMVESQIAPPPVALSPSRALSLEQLGGRRGTAEPVSFVWALFGWRFFFK